MGRQEPGEGLRRPPATDGVNMRSMIVEQLKSHDAKPHDVRGDIRDDDEFIYLMDHPDSDEEIPTLDISPYLSGRQGGCETVASQLRDISGRLFLPEGPRHPAGTNRSCFRTG